MKSSRSSLASRYSVAIILFLSCSMILLASALSVSPSSSLGTPSSMAYDGGAYDANVASATREMFAKPLVSPLAPVVTTTVTATKSHTPSGNRAPGDTLTYTVMITNTGGADATAVNFTDTIDPNTTLVGGSLKVSPIAVDDTYNTIGNVNISVPAGGLLTNDLNPGGMGTLGFTLINATPFVTGTAVATTHGSVTVNTDGSFTYTPTAGYAGPTDTFTYTLGNGTGLTDTATVTINISGMIWFVNNDPAAPGSAPGDGRLINPFRSFGGASSFNTIATDAAGDAIFIYTGTSTYTGGVTLLNNQKLIGQGAAASILAITGYSTPSGTNLLPNTSGTNPTIAAAVDNITLGSGNTVRGVTLNVTAVGATALTGSSFGTLTLAETTIGGTNGRALSLTTGTLTGPVSSTAAFTSISSTNSSLTGITLTSVAGAMSSGSTTITNSSGIGLSVNTSSATFNFATTSVTGTGSTGVSLLTNTGTITFAGITITPDANQRGLLATDNTNTITTTSGAITASGAVAVEITRASGATPLVMSLDSVAANGGTNGIILTSTSGSFTVTGTSGGLCGGQVTTHAVGTPATVTAPNTADCTGGTIQNTTGVGIQLNNAMNVSLTRVRLLNSGTDGINALNVNGFTLDHSLITDSSGVAGDRGIEMGDFSTGTPVNGTINITNSTLGPTPHDNFGLGIASGTSTWNVTGDVFTGSVLNSGFNIETRAATITSFLMDGCAVQNQFADGMQIQPASGVNSTITSATIQNSTFTGNNLHIDLNHDGTSNVAYKVLNNTLLNAATNSINFFSSATAGTGGSIGGRFVNNRIGDPAMFASGGGVGIRININGGAAAKVLCDSNVIRQIPNGRGIEIISRNGTGGCDATLTNNQVNTDFVSTVQNGGFSLSNIFLQSNCLSVCNTLRADIRGNTVPATPPTGELIAFQLAVIETGASTCQLVDNPPASATASAELTEAHTNPANNNTGSAGASAGVSLIAGPIMTPASRTTFEVTRASSPETDATAVTQIDDSLVVAGGALARDNNVASLKQAELDWMLQTALQRWRQAGTSPEDMSRLEAVTFKIEDLSGDYLAQGSSSEIKIDETGAGHGWYFDGTPMEDNEFDVPVPGRELQTTEYSPAHGKMDLLTVLMRELGSIYLQGKKNVPEALKALMESSLAPSVRRLPDPSAIQIQQPDPSSFSTQSQDAPAQGSSQQSSGSSSGRRAGRVGTSGHLSPQSGETVTQALGTIPVNEKVTLTFQVTIDNPLPANVCTVTNPAPGSGVNVTGSNFTSVTIAADPATIVKAPTIGACPANISKNTDANVCTAVATFTTPTSDACPAATVTCSPASGFAFAKGTTTVTCTAANGVLPDATCMFTVTVTDAQAPVLSGCTNQTINTAAGVCTATATYTPTATDNCDGSRPVTCVPASGATFNKGVTTVSCSASDLAATPNTGMCTFTITVNDNQAPVLSGCTNITTVTGPGVCTAAPTYAPTATDNCDGSRPVTCVPASGSTFTKGVTTVNCSASDLNTPTPNTGTCSFTVTVNDNQAPVLSGCTNITTNTAPGVCTAAPTFTPTATDNCDGSRPVTCLPASGSTFNKGVTTVTCSASDLATPTANTGMCSFTVTVNDNQAPVLSGCTNQTVNAGAGVCTAMATFTVTATDNCDGPRPVTCIPASGATFQKGVTTVNCSASDLNAPPNTGTCSFTISVNDSQPPVVTCPPSGGAFAASDCLPSQRSAYTGATLYSVGPNMVTNVVLSGFTPCTPPPVSGTANINFTGILTGDLTMGALPPTHFQAPVTGMMKVTFNNLTGATRTFDTEMLQLDIGDGNLPAGVRVRESPTLASTGQTKITTVTGGFHIDSFFDVFTELTTDGGQTWTPDPTARHIAAVQSTDAGACNAVVNYPAATATDNCDVVTPTCTPASGTTFSKGVTTVSCSVTDTSGNPGACSFTVTVLDTQLPTLTCPSNINVIGNTCQNVSYTTPTASDNCPSPTVSCAPVSGTCFAVGTTTVTCTATDMSGNTGSCSFTVTVTPCTITCPNSVSVDAAPGVCTAAVMFADPTTTGMCGTVTCVPASGSTFQKGVTTVTCSTTAGPSCAFTVTVNDTQPPVITCPAPIIQSTDPNVCTAVVTFAPTATDNCPLGPTPIVCSPASGSTFAKGVTTVTCTATDVSLNTAQCSFTVTINDTQVPVFTGCTNVSAFTASNSCDAVVTYTQPTATDNCDGARPVSCSPASGSTFPKGVTTVSCSASDANSPTVNTATCTFTVTVTDNVAPVMSGCTNVSAFTAANSCDAVVTYTQPTANDNCDGSRTVTCNPASGTTFNKGVTTVSCSASDTSGNPANCTFTVTVTDNVAPVFSGCTNVNANTASNACNAVVTYTQPTANDNCDGSRTVTCNPVSGTTFSKGVTTVSCSASDTSGNPANCTFTVTVTDNVAPVLSGCNNVSANTASNACTAVVTYTQPTANDNCDGARTVTCNPASGTTFNKGVTTVSCSATDTSSQTGTCTFTVTVTDVTAPSIACPANLTHGTDPGVCTAAVTYPAPVVSDNCPGVGTPVCTPASGTTFQKGVTTVSCTVSDASSNTANCTFTVTVNDTQNPTVTCPANITFTTPGFNDPCGTVTYATPSGSDNCPLGPNPVTCSPASGMCFAVGMTTVTCTATDTSGNQGSCTFKITVQNPCTITCPANITKNNDPGLCGAVATFAPTTSGGGCGTVACSPASGSVFPKGTTTVTCTTAGPSCSFTVTVNDTQPPAITCPANITKSTDPNVCQAVVTYPAPVVSDNCPGVGAPTCSPASGTTFPKGTTTVTCTVKDSSNNMSMCSFLVTVNDTQPPVFPNGCPAGITKAAEATCPITTTLLVTYTTPVATDNCGPAPTVVCNPPSGGVFPPGTTVVTCTATDSSGNTAICTFPVNVFSFCLQDDSISGNVVFVNAVTGEYLFCQNGVPIASGIGTLVLHGCNFQIDHTKGDRKVHIQGDTSANSGAGVGTAFISKATGPMIVQITDRKMTGDACMCSP